jgi:transposase
MSMLTKEILYKEYILNNLSSTEIAKKYNLSRRTISFWIKKYNLSKLYKDKEWLILNYITLDKSINEMSEEFKVSKATLSNWIKKFNIDKDKVYTSKNWLIKKYIEQNLSTDEIGNLCGTSGETIRLYINKYKINKSDHLKKEKFLSTMDNKYGKDWPSFSEESKEKRIKTLIDTNQMHQFKIKDKNKTLKEISAEHGVPYSTISEWVRDGKIIDNKDLLLQLNMWNSGQTSLESFFQNLSKLNFFNKKVSDQLGYRPDFKLNENVYINVDGLYWHSELVQDNNKYHFKMRKDYEDLDLRIIQFRADEIINKSEIVISMILNMQGLAKTKIFARKCIIKNVDQKSADIFYNKTHLMGSIKAKHMGLYYQGNLRCLLSFKEYKNSIKIERFSSSLKTVVVGGFSKLLSKIKSKKEIHYWVDLRYGTGNFLEKLGFVRKRETLGWKWTDFKNTYNRLHCRANMDSRGLSELEYARELKLFKIYDAGQRLWVLSSA